MLSKPKSWHEGTRLINIMMRVYNFVRMALLLVMVKLERFGEMMPRDQDQECQTFRVVIKLLVQY